MKIDIFENLVEAQTFWEERKIKRFPVENIFKKFTGHLFVFEIHVPFTRKDLLLKIIKDIKETPTDVIIILPGDSFTFDMFSKFNDKVHITNTMENEFYNMNLIIKILANIKNVKKVICLTSNHEDRLEKMLIKNVDKTNFSYFKSLKIIRGLQEVLEEHIDNEKFVFLDEWHVKIGDIITAHVNNFTAVWGKTVINCMRYFEKRCKFSVFIQAHTHRMVKQFFNRKIGIQVGVIAKPFDYERTGKIGASGMNDITHLGYAKCYLVNGRADVNKCNPIILDWEKPIYSI